MVITSETVLPTDAELTVPQEITLSTPWMKAVAPYMARTCEPEVKEYMLRRKELEDPRKTLKEAAAVTACGVKFLRALKKECLPEAEKYAYCIDHGDRDLFISRCRHEQLFMDKCVEDKLNIVRPPVGYFSKLHVHESIHPRPEPIRRDYKKEAAAVLDELPADTKEPKAYKEFKDWRMGFFTT